MIKVVKELCIGCGLCVKSCPKFLFKINNNVSVVDYDNCLECGHCGAVCPTEAIIINIPKAKIEKEPVITPSFDEVEKIIHSRRSIRRFKENIVDKPIVQRLLNLANQSPTGSNRQGVGYIVTSPEITKEIERLAMLEVPNANEYIKNLVKSKKDGITLGSPHIIAVYDYDDAGGFNAALASYVIDLASSSLGLGVCYNGILYHLYSKSEQMQKLLSIPVGYKICMFMSFGYSDEKYLRRVIRPRASITYL